MVYTRARERERMTASKKTSEEFFESAKESMKEEELEHKEESEMDEWNPTSPGTLRGYFMKATRHKTKHGFVYKAFVKDFDTEVTVSVFCARKMLRQGILDASPAKGTEIIFEYAGEAEGKSGFTYHTYYVRANKSDPELWAEITRPKPGEDDEQKQTEAASSFAPDEAPF